MKRILVSLLLALVAPALQAAPYLALDFAALERVELTGAPNMNGSSSQLAIGIPIGRSLALELGYIDGDGRGDPVAIAGGSRLQFWQASGPSLAAVGRLELASCTLTARLGLERLELEARDLATVNGVTTDIRRRRDLTTSSAGIGLELELSRRVALRAGLELRRGEDLEQRSANVGLIVHF